MAIFLDTKFLVVQTSQESDSYIQWIKSLIERNGGVAIIVQDTSKTNDLERKEINHVITSTYEFTDFHDVQDLMIPITSPEWLEDSELACQKKNYRLYSPVPLPFLDKVVVCIADNLPEGDKEVMYAGVRAFGGQYLDALLRYTTHLIAVDLSNNKSVVAANIKKLEDLQIRIVLPHWIDDCIRSQRHVDESPYLLLDPVVLRTGRPNFPPTTTADGEEPPRESTEAAPLAGKTVYLAKDYNLSEHLQESIYAMISECGASMADTFDPDHVLVYVGKYRNGSEYKEAVESPTVDVASLEWVYFLARRHAYVPPLQSNMLHFPVPRKEVPGFANKRISVTGYSGDARHYLTQLITAMGGIFTKTLDSENDFLVTAVHRGEKYNAVKTRWNNISVVNHLWIEECFSKWGFLDPKSLHYTKVDKNTRPLGLTRVDLKCLESKKAELPSPMLDVDDSDSLSIPEAANSQAAKPQELVELPENVLSAGPIKETSKSAEPESDMETSKAGSPDSPEMETSRSPENELPQAVEPPSEVAEPPSEVAEPASDALLVMDPPELATTSSRGRSAKAKASEKLHTNMEDLNEFLLVSKSSRKMKSYMEQLEKDAQKRKAKTTDNGENSETENPQELVLPPPKKKAKKLPKETPHVTAIITGCEQEIVLNRADIVKLGRVGIQVGNELSGATGQNKNVIVAPRILRTEKFLKGLSRCDSIVHPRYLTEVLSLLKSDPEITWTQIEKQVSIKYYLLDRIVPIKEINDDLGVKGPQSGLEKLLHSENRGKVFSGMTLNLSTNLNGGADLIASILAEHNVERTKTVKLTPSTGKDLLDLDKDRRIVVGHKSKDRKVASRLSGKDVVFVEWDWCVKSIFKQELENLDEYKL